MRSAPPLEPLPEPRDTEAEQHARFRAYVRLVTLHEVAERLSLSYWSARDLVLRGHLASVRLPGKSGKDLRRILVAESDLQAFIDAHRVQPTTDVPVVVRRKRSA